ncbi:MAG: histidine kinase [Burkholderiales bacterium]|nr:histidine kinase [Burkholderiales bacterium]
MPAASSEPSEFPGAGNDAAPTEAGHRSGRAGAAIAWLAESLRGVTWKRAGLFLLMFALLAASSTPTARAVGYGAGIARVVEAFLLTFVPTAVGYGVPTLALIGVANHTRPGSRARAGALLAVVVLGSALAAAVGGYGYQWAGGPGGVRFHARWMEAMVEFAAVCAIWLLVNRRDANHDALRQAQLDRIAADRRLTEAHALTLQAQIEPHFLFNALANVRRLLQTDRTAGQAMLRQLAHYLAATLPALRDARSTLGRELALTVAYLDVQRIRMGERLTTTVDVPAAVRDARFPPMLLMTLVETAIKHGLAPLPEGGGIAISAEAAGDRLRVRVQDSGAGIRHTGGKGIGIANSRARLAALYGGAARLALADGVGGVRGVTATVELPLEFAREGAASP